MIAHDLSLVDMRDHLNAVDAKAYFDRAELRGDDKSLADWARRYGRGLCVRADDVVGIEDHIEEDRRSLETELEDAEGKLSDLRGALEAAIKKAESAADNAETRGQMQAALDGLLDAIESAL